MFNSLIHQSPWLFKPMQEAKKTWQSLPLPKIERVKLEDWPFCSRPTGKQTQTSDTTEGNPAIQIKAAEPIIACDWTTALKKYPELFKKYLFQAIPPNQDRISAYNLAELNQGTFIYVPPHTLVEDIIQVSLDLQQAPHQYILLVIGENAQADYLEKVISSNRGSATSHSLMIEVILEKGAHLRYMALDKNKTKQSTVTYLRRHAKADNQSTIHWAIGAFNESDTILDLDTLLLGEGSQAQSSVVAVADGDQKQIVDSKIHNHGHHSVGHINQHGVVLDQATLTMNGIGYISKDAKQADAQQENRLLMLSDKARGDANPILLIEEYEVTAGHAASVARVDENQLWYLMSRGIAREEAEYMVIRGFLMQAVTLLKDKQAREIILEALDEKLSGFKRSILKQEDVYE